MLPVGEIETPNEAELDFEVSCTEATVRSPPTVAVSGALPAVTDAHNGSDWRCWI
jgi:hypothetical protein